jgi:hypothetical protein
VKDAVTDGVKETVCDGEFVLVMVFVWVTVFDGV